MQEPASDNHGPSNGLAARDLDPPFLAKPSGACCLEGSVHSGNPRGHFFDVAGVDTYVSKPPAQKSNGNILLYYPDVWGMFTNGLLVMDGFADAGYLTIGLDYFRGDPVWKHRRDRFDVDSAPEFDYEAWKRKHIAFADEAVPKWNAAVKEQFGNEKTRYACVGYCFGAPYVCNSLAPMEGRKPDCEVGAFAHPAFLKEQHFHAIERPLFLSCSEVDHTFDTKSRRRALDILSEAGKTYNLQLFSGVQHGFALRADMTKLYERWVKEESLGGIARWFDYWLGQDGPAESK